jgi:hypothetical protein
MILPAAPISDVRLDPQPDDGEILDRVVFGINPADHMEALAVVNIMAQGLQLRTKGWEREFFLVD